MKFNNLLDWLAWQETLHPRSIDLGLARVAAVRDRLGIDEPSYRVITVGGTNGKGSVAAFLTALLTAAGHRVGTYTSPHLQRYNERIVIDGREAGDDALCTAFEAVDGARGDTSLTYFEFGTLAALDLFRRGACDVVVLEVGMGGRLDATNTLDADAAVVVSVGLDHMEWLGADREAIGYEKAGIFRAGRPAVCADAEPPDSLSAHAESIGARLLAVGRDYRYDVGGDGRWDFHGPATAYRSLPAPALPGRVQYGNAAAALAALDALPALFGPDADVVAAGLTQAALRGRFQRVARDPDIIVDVTHNPHGAAVLARELAATAAGGRTFAVCGMLADKQVGATLAALDPQVDHWLLASLPGPRALGGAELAARADLSGAAEPCGDVTAALDRARTLAAPGDRIIVFGSFLTAGAALAMLNSSHGSHP